MRSFTVVSIAALATASVALAGGSHLITQSSIGGGKLGQNRTAYKALYGKPMPAENLEGGLTRLRYQSGAIEVYFKTGTDSGRYIVATSKAYKTAKSVGPCAKSSAVKTAYPSVVKVPLAGGEYAYRLGTKLWFEIESARVAAVALGAGKSTAWIASNSPACGS
ncbi:MAG TPA: hypothetical protein VII83_02290 [Gaiellaceae bacterium]